jgi:hypothetical protein
MKIAVFLNNDGYFLGGSHVVVGLELERGWVGVKVAFELT